MCSLYHIVLVNFPTNPCEFKFFFFFKSLTGFIVIICNEVLFLHRIKWNVYYFWESGTSELIGTNHRP